MANRCQKMADMFANAADYEKALERIGLAERARGPADGTLLYDDLRAGIYSKMGKPELDLDGEMIALHSPKARAVLVIFFFPT